MNAREAKKGLWVAPSHVPPWEWRKNVLNHKSLAHTTIYARLNTKAVDRALQTQADRLCSLMSGVEVLPALTQDLHLTAIGGERPRE